MVAGTMAVAGELCLFVVHFAHAQLYRCQCQTLFVNDRIGAVLVLSSLGGSSVLRLGDFLVGEVVTSSLSRSTGAMAVLASTLDDSSTPVLLRFVMVRCSGVARVIICPFYFWSLLVASANESKAPTTVNNIHCPCSLGDELAYLYWSCEYAYSCCYLKSIA